MPCGLGLGLGVGLVFNLRFVSGLFGPSTNSDVYGHNPPYLGGLCTCKSPFPVSGLFGPSTNSAGKSLCRSQIRIRGSRGIVVGVKIRITGSGVGVGVGVGEWERVVLGLGLGL